MLKILMKYNFNKVWLLHIHIHSYFFFFLSESIWKWRLVNPQLWKLKLPHWCCECCPGKFDRITYSLKLKRKPAYFIMYLVVPSVLISILVLFSFKIPVDSGERIGLCTTALLAMSVFLLLIGEYLPESSENIPLLAIASVLMMILITFGFSCHHSCVKMPPQYTSPTKNCHGIVLCKKNEISKKCP